MIDPKVGMACQLRSEKPHGPVMSVVAVVGDLSVKEDTAVLCTWNASGGIIGGDRFKCVALDPIDEDATPAGT